MRSENTTTRVSLPHPTRCAADDPVAPASSPVPPRPPKPAHPAGAGPRARPECLRGRQERFEERPREQPVLRVDDRAPGRRVQPGVVDSCSTACSATVGSTGWMYGSARCFQLCATSAPTSRELRCRRTYKCSLSFAVSLPVSYGGRVEQLTSSARDSGLPFARTSAAGRQIRA